jgi:hypothetical protein
LSGSSLFPLLLNALNLTIFFSLTSILSIRELADALIENQTVEALMYEPFLHSSMLESVYYAFVTA